MWLNRKIILAALLGVFNAGAQPKVKIIINKIPEPQKEDAIYIAGSFNNWDPANDAYKLVPQPDGRRIITIKAKMDDILEFKFTRGNWDKVETETGGADITNHAIKVTGDTTLYYTIGDWKDAFSASTTKPHTASSQVLLLDSAFKLKALGVKRRVWIYLPKDYATSKKRYPVLYMHDGQNLFDEATAAYGEWGVDELLDEYFDAYAKSCIVIGIDNGLDKRIAEYNPYDNKKFGKGLGQKYIQSIVETLKPFVDKRYRTLKDKPNTWIAGSSMGGLITQWAVMAYPSVFGKAGIFSPSFPMTPMINTDVKTMLKGYNGKLFYYCGGMESKTMVRDMDKVIASVKAVSSAAEIVRSIREEGRHSEQDWKTVFPEFIKMIFE